MRTLAYSWKLSLACVAIGVCSYVTWFYMLHPLLPMRLSSLPPPLLPSSALPSLLAEYALWHEKEVQKRPEGRFLVSVPTHAGFADRAIGSVSEFWLAFFSGRAFQIAAPPTNGVPPFEYALDYAAINWTRGYEGVRETQIMKIIYDVSNHRSALPPFGASSEYCLFHEYNAWSHELQHYSQNDLRLFPYDCANPTVFMSSNRGRTFSMVRRNRYLKTTFEALDIRPEFAFAVAFKFLFKPNIYTTQAYKSVWQKLDQPHTLRISIHIRVGDHVFNQAADAQTQFDRWQYIFDCAQQIENFALYNMSFSLPGPTRVIWYLASDSLRLRQLATAKYGDKILTDVATSYAHGNCKGEECDKRGNLVHAVGQMYAMAKCDYHIYRKETGFGRMGAWLSQRLNNLYVMDDAPRKCGPHDATLHENDSEVWSGI